MNQHELANLPEDTFVFRIERVTDTTKEEGYGVRN